MAQRQYMRKIRTGSARFEDVYRAVNEYRTRFPEKAVVYSAQKYPELGWAALMAGGSCAVVPVKDSDFLTDVAKMHPSGHLGGVYTMEDAQTGALVFIDGNGKEATMNLSSGTYRLCQIDPLTGNIKELKVREHIDRSYTFSGNGVFWLKKLK